MQYIKDDILYFEGEHIINIVKEPDISRRIYSKRVLKSSNIEDFNANYFWYGKVLNLQPHMAIDSLMHFILTIVI